MGLKRLKYLYFGNIILFIISISITYLSTFIGNFFKFIFPISLEKLISSLILIFIGIYIYRKSLKENSKDSNIFNNPISSDFDKSKIIDSKEAIFLAIALSLDSLCIGIGASISDIDLRLFPILVSTFQIIFLSVGTYLGTHISKLCKLPQNIWGLISGTLLFLIGILKFFL